MALNKSPRVYEVGHGYLGTRFSTLARARVFAREEADRLGHGVSVWKIEYPSWYWEVQRVVYRAKPRGEKG